MIKEEKRTYNDLHIQVYSQATNNEAHQVGHCVSELVRRQIEGVFGVVVLVELYKYVVIPILSFILTV